MLSLRTEAFLPGKIYLVTGTNMRRGVDLFDQFQRKGKRRIQRTLQTPQLNGFGLVIITLILKSESDRRYPILQLAHVHT